MPNHFHIEIKQNTSLNIGKLITKVCTSYAKSFNNRYSRIGNLFQDTFKAKVIETEEYLVQLSAYIHNNPEKPFDYPYSSIHEYMSSQNDLCDTNEIMLYFNQDVLEYKKYLIEQSKTPPKKEFFFDWNPKMTIGIWQGGINLVFGAVYDIIMWQNRSIILFSKQKNVFG